jgi:phosphoribosylaminoimidazole-succinocarboxamide synthase
MKGYDSYVGGTSKTKPKHLSKEFLREWLLAQGYEGEGEPPEMTDEFVQEISARYIELFERMTGQDFVKAKGGDPLERIKRNVLHYIKENLA